MDCALLSHVAHDGLCLRPSGLLVDAKDLHRLPIVFVRTHLRLITHWIVHAFHTPP